MKKHLFFLYSICIIMICGLFPYNIPFDLTHSYSENEPIQVMAASAGHTDIKHAKTLRSGTSFQTKAAPEGFHYYCLFAPASRGEMTIKIRSSQRISLTITYSYTKTAPSPSPIIKHKRSPQKPKPLGTAKPSGTAKPQTQRKNAPSSVRRTATPGRKAAPSGRRTATPGRKAASSGRNPNNSVQAGRKNTKAFADNTSKISLSSTFLHVRKGEAFSLHATAVTSQNYHLNWEFSSSGFLKKSSVKSRKNSSDITLTANRTGMVIVTCRTKENRTISCSCTIKITE